MLYDCSVNPVEWGLSASFTINDETYVDEIIDQIKLGVLRLSDNGFNMYDRFRFYNELIAHPGRTCQAGVGIFAIGTNLEVWPCQSVIDKPPLGYFDENIKDLLATSRAHKYFFNRTLLPRCTDCNVLNWCRGGCRAVRLSDMKAVEITCRIKQEIISFILRETQNYQHRHNSHNGNYLSDSGLDTIIKDYVTNDLKAGTKPQFVETPPLPE